LRTAETVFITVWTSFISANQQQCNSVSY